jgi:hypothetical protein
MAVLSLDLFVEVKPPSPSPDDDDAESVMTVTTSLHSVSVPYRKTRSNAIHLTVMGSDLRPSVKATTVIQCLLMKMWIRVGLFHIKSVVKK